jgi:hypothetical protein
MPAEETTSASGAAASNERGRRAVKLLRKQAERPFEPTGIDDAIVERS